MNRWQSWNSGILVIGSERGIESMVLKKWPVVSITLMTSASCGHSARWTAAVLEVAGVSRPLHPPTVSSSSTASDALSADWKRGGLIRPSRGSEATLWSAHSRHSAGEVAQPADSGLQEGIRVGPEDGHDAGPACCGASVAHPCRQFRP